MLPVSPWGAEVRTRRCHVNAALGSPALPTSPEGCSNAARRPRLRSCCFLRGSFKARLGHWQAGFKGSAQLFKALIVPSLTPAAASRCRERRVRPGPVGTGKAPNEDRAKLPPLCPDHKAASQTPPFPQLYIACRALWHAGKILQTTRLLGSLPRATGARQADLPHTWRPTPSAPHHPPLSRASTPSRHCSPAVARGQISPFHKAPGPRAEQSRAPGGKGRIKTLVGGVTGPPGQDKCKQSPCPVLLSLPPDPAPVPGLATPSHLAPSTRVKPVPGCLQPIGQSGSDANKVMLQLANPQCRARPPGLQRESRRRAWPRQGPCRDGRPRHSCPRPRPHAGMPKPTHPHQHACTHNSIHTCLPETHNLQAP